MLEDLDCLSDNVDEDAELGEGVADRLQALLRHLRDHEAIERRILQDVIDAQGFPFARPAFPPPPVAWPPVSS